jgi:transcriptional regulator with XRE-family HTH domain
MYPRIQAEAIMWDAPYMNETALQRFIKQALAYAPEARDHYDKMIQRKESTTGKPIYDIERGKSKNPSVQTLINIAEVLRQPLALLMQASQGQFVDAAAWGEKTGENVIENYAVRDDGSIALRLLDLDQPTREGTGLDAYLVAGAVDFDLKLLSSLTQTPADRLFVARGSDDSMFPTLIHGDLVIIDPSQRILNLQDRIWAITLFGAGGIKRLQPASAGKIAL